MSATIYMGCLILFIWEVILLPKYVAKKIIEIIQKKGYKVVALKLISRRDCIYSIDYLKNGQLVREHIRYGILGSIKWL